jgi:MFS family permease
MSRRFGLTEADDRSLRRAVEDGKGHAVLQGAAENYVGAYAILMQATAAQVAILSAFPAWLGSLVQIFSALIAGRWVRRKSLIVFGAAVQIAVIPALVLLPWLDPDLAVPALIVLAAIYHAGINLAQPNWNGLIGDLLPERRRGRWFGRRTAWVNVITFGSMAGAGVVLHRFQLADMAYVGFAVLFAVGALGRLYSLYHLSRMTDPGPPAEASPSAAEPLSLLLRLRQSDFMRYSLSIGLMYAAVVFAGPFFQVYMLRDLHYSYLELMGNMAASAVTQTMLLPLWGRVRDRYGNRLLIVASGWMIPLVPIVWIVTTDYWILILSQMVAGAAWSGYSLASSTFLYDTVSPRRRGLFSAIHTVLAMSMWFFGGLLAAYVSGLMPNSLSLGPWTWNWQSALVPMFLLSAVARAAVAALTLPNLRDTNPVAPRRRLRFARRGGRWPWQYR